MEPISYPRIALLGKMASGKTHYALRLLEANPKMHRLAFADPIKELAHDLFGMEGKDRKLLQQIGSKMREIDENVWINTLLRRAEGYASVVVDDVRYPNEIRSLQEAGFHIRYLEVSPQTQRARIMNIYGEDWQQHFDNMGHDSERADQYRELADSVVPESTDTIIHQNGELS